MNIFHEKWRRDSTSTSKRFDIKLFFCYDLGMQKTNPFSCRYIQDIFFEKWTPIPEVRSGRVKNSGWSVRVHLGRVGFRFFGPINKRLHVGSGQNSGCSGRVGSG